jgi:hypothetical protein
VDGGIWKIVLDEERPKAACTEVVERLLKKRAPTRYPAEIRGDLWKTFGNHQGDKDGLSDEASASGEVSRVKVIKSRRKGHLRDRVKMVPHETLSDLRPNIKDEGLPHLIPDSRNSSLWHTVDMWDTGWRESGDERYPDFIAKDLPDEREFIFAASTLIRFRNWT